MNEARSRALEQICADLERCIKSSLRDTESCLAFWSAIPETRSGCNDLTTFSSREAVLAYAYQHLPRRYLRTWDALTALTVRACLPLGRHGVRVLDVGTGPGTITFAINDFYKALRSFGQEQAIELLARQITEFSTVESNEHMQLFLSYFREVTERSLPTSGTYADFAKFSPKTERRQYYENLLGEEDWNEMEGEYEPAFTEYFANLEAQGVARFRFVVMSYFLTTPAGLQLFETALTELARDLRPGSVVMLLGAPGHEPVHREVERIMDLGHFRRLLEVPQQLDTASELEIVIKRCQQRVYEHIANIVGEDRLPRDGYPDYWNPEPHRRVKTEFRMTAFRKGRWPSNRKLKSALPH